MISRRCAELSSCTPARSPSPFQVGNATLDLDRLWSEMLIAKAKADQKANEKKEGEALKPQKEALIKSIRGCNNKATLDKIAKLLA